MDFDGLRSDIVRMLGGERISVNTHSFQNDMCTFRTRDDVLTLLIHIPRTYSERNADRIFSQGEYPSHKPAPHRADPSINCAENQDTASAAPEQKFICVSRPRRFGKSMALRMLAAYYSRGCDSRELFSGMKIESEINSHTTLPPQPISSALILLQYRYIILLFYHGNTHEEFSVQGVCGW